MIKANHSMLNRKSLLSIHCDLDILFCHKIQLLEIFSKENEMKRNILAFPRP